MIWEGWIHKTLSLRSSKPLQERTERITQRQHPTNLELVVTRWARSRQSLYILPGHMTDIRT